MGKDAKKDLEKGVPRGLLVLGALFYLISTLAFAAGPLPAPVPPPPCYPCPTTVNTHQSCGSVTKTALPFTVGCGPTDTRKKLPITNLSANPACTYSPNNQLPLTVTCKKNVPVSCEPCCGAACPANKPVLTGTSDP